MEFYRILYWLGSMKTMYLTRANSEKEAIKKFRETKGDKNIIDVEKFPFRVLN